MQQSEETTTNTFTEDAEDDRILILNGAERLKYFAEHLEPGNQANGPSNASVCRRLSKLLRIR